MVSTLSSHDRTIIYITSLLSAGLSTISACILLFTYFILPSFRTTPRILITILTVVDLLGNLSSLTLLIPSRSSDIACTLYTLTSSFFNCSSFLWTMCTSYVIYRTTIDIEWKLEDDRSRLRWMTLICFGYPTIWCIAMIVTLPNSSDEEDIGCWIPRRPFTNQVLRFGSTYLPLWIAWIFNATMYFITIRRGQRALAVLHEPNYHVAIDTETSTHDIHDDHTYYHTYQSPRKINSYHSPRGQQHSHNTSNPLTAVVDLSTVDPIPTIPIEAIRPDRFHSTDLSSPSSSSISSRSSSHVTGDGHLIRTSAPQPPLDPYHVGSQLRRLTFIPVAFVLIRVWGSINLIKDSIDPDTHFFIIDILEAIGDQAQALVHASLLVLSHAGVRHAIYNWYQTINCRTLCCRCRKHDDVPLLQSQSSRKPKIRVTRIPTP